MELSDFHLEVPLIFQKSKVEESTYFYLVILCAFKCSFFFFLMKAQYGSSNKENNVKGKINK